MSDMVKSAGCANVRKYLLVTVSAAALCMTTGAEADENGRPTVWIELGGQFEHIEGASQSYQPGFLTSFENLEFDPVLPVQSIERNSFGESGRITFAPKNSHWDFSAAVRIGRSSGHKNRYQQLPVITFSVQTLFGAPKQGYAYQPQHLNATASNSERYAILDFQAGKDVGLGMFSNISSVLSAGVRIAQFTSSRSAVFNGVPDFFHTGTNVKYGVFQSHHRYYGSMTTVSSFHGIGPSLSWNVSAPVVDAVDSDISIDLGINGAVLFGRQKVRGQANETGEHYKSFVKISLLGYTHYAGVASSYHHNSPIDRARDVIVPNVGGFVGLSSRYRNAKVSLGYRADFFFGAIDGGIEARRAYDRNFYGPYASVSIGLGG